MSVLRPGSWPWLLRHEMRLAWRGLNSAKGGSGEVKRSRGRIVWLVIIGILGGLLWLLFHFAAYMLLRKVDTAALPPIVQVLLGAGLWFLFTLMLSHTILMAVNVLFDRGDFDLLLASPLPPRNIFITRGLGVAFTTPLLYLLLLSPFADAGVFTGNANLLAIYPALLSLGLLATAIGMVLTISLVRWLGARRARVAAQLLGAFVGAAIFLLSQARNFVGGKTIDWRALVGQASHAEGWLSAGSPLWLPAQAALGRPLPLLLLMAVSVAAFGLVVTLTARHFLAGTQESQVEPGLPVNDLAPGDSSFRAGLVSVVLLKEWKLLWRDPQLIAQTLLQTLYLVPVAFAWGRNGSVAALLLPATTVAAASLASGLSWLTVAAEDAPELVASAPVSLARVRAIKLLAALLPVWALVLPLAVFVPGHDLAGIAAFFFCVLGATTSAGVIHLQLSLPGDRKNLRRRGKGNFMAGLLEVVNTIGWGGLAGLLLTYPAYAGLAAVPAFAAPALAVWRGRVRRRAALEV